MTCPKCNNQNPDGVQFCAVCGEKIENVQSNEAVKPKVNINKNLILIIIIVVGIMVIALVCFYLLIPNSNKNTYQIGDLTIDMPKEMINADPDSTSETTKVWHKKRELVKTTEALGQNYDFICVTYVSYSEYKMTPESYIETRQNEKSSKEAHSTYSIPKKEVINGTEWTTVTEKSDYYGKNIMYLASYKGRLYLYEITNYLLDCKEIHEAAYHSLKFN